MKNNAEIKVKDAIKISPEIKEFIEALIVEKGVDNLPGDLLGELMADLYERFGDYFLVNIAKSLSEEDFYTFEELLENSDSAQEIQDFIEKNADYKKIIQETCDEFRKIFLA